MFFWVADEFVRGDGFGVAPTGSDEALFDLYPD